MNLSEQQEKAWRLAPEDAKWIAQDSDGRFWWYDYKPSSDSDSWLISMQLESEEGYLFDGKINGWDWRDTLKAREEWEAMKPTAELDDIANPIKEKWIPEAGQECEAQIYPANKGPEWRKCELLKLNHNDLHAVLVGDSLYWAKNLRPIQTQADKYREEQIEKLQWDLEYYQQEMYYPQAATEDNKKFAGWLHRNGWRILTPDEFVAKRLTDEQAEEIWLSYTDPLITGFLSEKDKVLWVIKAVQNAILGGEE